MTYVCECIFRHEDPGNPGYSLTEHDLYPRVGPLGEAYSIPRNIDEELYEIFDYEHTQAYTDQAVWFADNSLQTVVTEAQSLEVAATGSTKLEYGHHADTIQCELTWKDTVDSDKDEGRDRDRL